MGRNPLIIDFVGHACLKVSHGNTSLLTDPWLDGPAFSEQWYPYPPTSRSVSVDDVQYIQYSHGHEDHMHGPSFHLLPKNATVLLTKQWFAGNREWILSQGFERVLEMTSGRWFPLGEDLSLVSLVNRSDSLSILCSPDEVVVNANDALGGYDDDCIDFYCRRIRSLLRGRAIDYLFCGFGGSGYFPNCLRHPLKDDQVVASAREAHLTKGFARVVGNLKPRMAFAFAAGFVLLDPVNQWINEVKFANDPVAITTELLPEMEGRVFQLNPGDRIVEGTLIRGAASVSEDPVADYQRLYSQEIRAKVERPGLGFDCAVAALEALEKNVRERLNRQRRSRVEFDWAVRLRDCPEAILRVTRTHGRLCAVMVRPDQLGAVRDMVVDVNSDVVLAAIGSLWGGDSLQAGYGAIFHLRSKRSVDEDHSRHFLKLATKMPLQSDYLRLSPLRGVSHLAHSPYLARQAARMILPKANRPTADSAGRGAIMDTRRWIEAPPCAGCPVCDIALDENIAREALPS